MVDDPPSAGAVTPAPVVIGDAVPTYNLSFWVPRIPDDDTCHIVTEGLGARPCFGEVDLGAHLIGLPARVRGTGRFLVHWSESFVCTDVATLVKDSSADRRKTLHGYALTADPYFSGGGMFTTDTSGNALLPSQKFFTHSPNADWPDRVGLACGPGESVGRSAVVLDKLTLYLYLLGKGGVVIRTYPAIFVPGTYVAPWWDFTGGNVGCGYGCILAP